MRWQVPGYVLQELLGFGGAGEVWRARHTSSGRQVVVKRLRGAAADVRAVSRFEQVVRVTTHPHLAELYDVGTAGDDVAVVSECLSGGSLAAIAETRRLTPGEVITVLIPIAAALQHLHDRGLAHGKVTPANILFAADGRPVLADLGTADLTRQRAAGATGMSADSDVVGLAALGFRALAGVPAFDGATGARRDLRKSAPDAPDALVTAIERVLASADADRGSAADFAAAVRAAGPAEPVGLDAPTDQGGEPAGDHVVLEAVCGTGRERSVHTATGELRRTGGRHAADRGRPARARWPWSRSIRHPAWMVAILRSRFATALTAGLLAVIAVAAAIWMGGVWAGAEPASRPMAEVHADQSGETSPPRPVSATSSLSAALTVAPDSAPASVGLTSEVSSPASDSQWRLIMQDLYDRRVTAFASADPAPLAKVYVSDSPQLAADEQAVQDLADAGQSLSGFHLHVESVQVITAQADRAELRVVDSYDPFDVVAGEEVIAHDPGRAAATVSTVLIRTSAGWRMLSAQLLT